MARHSAKLRQPQVAILIVHEGEDADHPSTKIASNRRSSRCSLDLGDLAVGGIAYRAMPYKQALSRMSAAVVANAGLSQ